MGKRRDVFRHVVEIGIARLFSGCPSLTERLDANPSRTLFDLSTAPECFGVVKLAGEERRLALEQLLTASAAYVRACRAEEETDVHPELALEADKPFAS